jgi:putative Mg2+ transporter-C (MgtC) family protein
MEWAELGQQAGAMGLAAILGGLIGLEREMKGRWAGLRTHMLVALGTCLFVLVGLAASPDLDKPTVLSRVIQGICAGIGFIGAGTILKLTEHLEVQGLTTASSIWTAAAIGAACGIHQPMLAASGTILALIILWGFRLIEKRVSPNPTSDLPERVSSDNGKTHRQRRKKEQEALDKRNRGQTA